MKIDDCFDHLRKAVDDTIQDLEIQKKQLQQELDDVDGVLSDIRNELQDALAILSPARALATEIERRFALRLDPGPTEQDFRELLQLLTEGS
jgi:phage shock protein A